MKPFRFTSLKTNSRRNGGILKHLVSLSFFSLASLTVSQANAVVFDVSEAGGWTATDSPEVTLVNPSGNLGEATAPAGTFTRSEWLLNSPNPSALIFDFFNADITVGDNPGDSGSTVITRLTQINNELTAEEAGDPNFSFPFTHTENFALNFVIAEDGNESNHIFEDNPTGFVTHTETVNEAPCAPDGNPTGPAGSTCDDIFAFGIGLSPGVFFYDGVAYQLSFDLVSSELNDTPIVFIDGLIYTPENDLNILDVVLTITRLANNVSEPGVIALLGLGLLGFGLARRRKIANS